MLGSERFRSEGSIHETLGFEKFRSEGSIHETLGSERFRSQASIHETLGSVRFRRQGSIHEMLGHFSKYGMCLHMTYFVFHIACFLFHIAFFLLFIICESEKQFLCSSCWGFRMGLLYVFFSWILVLLMVLSLRTNSALMKTSWKTRGDTVVAFYGFVCSWTFIKMNLVP